MKQINQVIIMGDNQLAKNLYKLCEKLEQDVFLNDLGYGGYADIIIETENSSKEQKKQNIQEIEEAVKADTTILSTSLRVSATEIASWLADSSRLIGFGTFADLESANLIEITPALQSNPFHLTVSADFLQMVGKEVEVVRDEVGLVFPRILSMIINEAAFALMEKTADAANIDEAMKKGTNYPNGPLEWAEKIGLEDVCAVLTGLQEELGEERYRPAPLIKKLIHAGWTGEETQKGFYYYENRTKGEVMQ